MTRPGWLATSDLRIGLGCMRLPEETAHETIAAAVEAGITVFDTARSYDGNEQLVASALRGVDGIRIVTKGGMARNAGAWIPDGRAKAIRTDCEASLTALDGLPIDLYLIHAPDPRTPWPTTVRALGRLVDEGLVHRVGVANVNRRLLDEALELAPIAAVQVALSPFDVGRIRGGVLERCDERGIALVAHSPLGGTPRAAQLARHEALMAVAQAHGATASEVALAWLLALSPNVVAIPGARRPGTARSAARAAAIALAAGERERLDRAFDISRARVEHAQPRREGEVVVVMGIPGAGKSRAADEYVARGYVRLNRDEQGGSLRELAAALDGALAAGVSWIVLDNTYPTRASRSFVVEVASRHGVAARCVWLDTPLAQAQVNLVERLLDRFGSLPSPDELRELAKREQGVLAPTSQMRALRELDPPAVNEGFATVEHLPFAREPALRSRAGVFVAAAAVMAPESAQALELVDAEAPCLVFDWNADGSGEAVSAAAAVLETKVPGPVESALCPHGGGPPKCWCRPPLPGLALAFARAHKVVPARSLLVGTGTAHRTLARTLGARYVEV